MSLYLYGTALGVSVTCRVYHRTLYTIGDHLNTKRYDWDDAMDAMTRKGYTAANTAIPTACKTATDVFLLYSVGGKLADQVTYVLDEYVTPLIDWVGELIRGIPANAESFFTRMLTTVQRWYTRVQQYEMPDLTWASIKAEIEVFLGSLGIGYGTGQAFDWAAVWQAVKQNAQQLARSIAGVLWRLCGLLWTLLNDATVAAAGWLYKYGKKEATVVLLQYGYLAYLVEQHYKNAAVAQ